MSARMIVLDSREEWLESRNRIGGSDAACILGLNPWRSNADLFEIKTGAKVQEDISDKPLVKYGTNAEQYLRELFKLDHPELKVFYEENNIWLNDDFPFAHASLDGWLEDAECRNGILEFKTSTISSKAMKEEWNGKIPDYYYSQLIHYFMVTEFDFAILVAQLKYDYDGEVYKVTKEYRFERSEVLDDIEVLKAAEMEFWDAVQNNKKPARLLPNI